MSDEISHLELSPSTSTLSGVSEPAHYLPMSVGRRGTVTSITSSANGHAKGATNGDTTPTTPTPGATPRSGSLRSRALSINHQYLPSKGSPPPPMPTKTVPLPSPVPSRNPPPSYHSPPLAAERKPVAPAPPVVFASLMLLGQDKIRIAGFPESCQELLRNVLSKGWTGVEGKRNPAPGVFEWKLAKSPWSADAPLASFRLIEFILFSLSKEGWSLALSAGMPGKHNARDTFFFMPTERRQRRFFSVIFGTHMITLLDAPDPRVCEAFVQACETWPGGAGSLYSREHGAFAINMKRLGDGDTAWPTTGGKYEHAMPQLMCVVLQRMAMVGYECVTTYDVLDRNASWHWNDAKGIVTGSMPAIDVWVFAER
ncbi:hypothetical protein CC85DRAFT_304679 [Cutaneotrichosporon oleaginosum]|uniref:Uncharacterized protein n=1 Tax=Cutaneotrichosporon oleaginosum TaxID=879819 RepID=A0A0J1AX28_9TREE|nr:uncharacterized protein CC85DRAFT_304679 [Cutaneotrichosporon oleaginosum]KLT39869.1 hypothetical protein CC85DRAFT_304679 [Cutaneotrichosporon oleaginosum]TXT05466.1 hypothetical protein COLE_06786 [Cutaneotrichosporon oleaginosum]